MTPEEISITADQCVKCGFCLPLCPTYGKTGDEGESPRGRIALIQGLAQGVLENTPRLGGHLARCLVCRACEAGCPSGVAYGKLIDAGIALSHGKQGRISRWLGRAARGIIVRQRFLRAAASLFRLYQRSGLQFVLRATGILDVLRLRRLDKLLPALPAPFKVRDLPLNSSNPPTRPLVALFAGCISQIVETPVLHNTTELLARLGYEVAVPYGQCCCGALHRHAGDPKTASRLLEQNVKAFTSCEFEAIVSIDSGCSAHLIEYPSFVAPKHRKQAAECADRIQDINHFLAGLAWPSDLVLKPSPARVAVHEPCTLRNVLKQQHAAYELLRKIPGINLLELPENQFCCGSAGAYIVNQPAMSQALLNDKITAIRSCNPHILVTSNIGCSLQLAAGIRSANLNIEVLHPVQLLVRQLQNL